MTEAQAITLKEVERHIELCRWKLAALEEVRADILGVQAEPAEPVIVNEPAMPPAVQAVPVKPSPRKWRRKSAYVTKDGINPVSDDQKARERQQRIAELLRREGPRGRTYIMAALGWHSESMFHDAVDGCPYFEREADGYHLTHEGRAAMQGGEQE